MLPDVGDEREGMHDVAERGGPDHQDGAHLRALPVAAGAAALPPEDETP
jgi:hypothetical protein